MEWLWIAVCVLTTVAGVGAVIYFWYQNLTQHEIVLINGFGKYYFGWHPLGENTYRATKWVVLMYLPVYPLERQVFNPVDNSASHASPTILEYAAALAGGVVSEKTLLYIQSREKPVRAEVLNTYLLTYLYGPLALFGPLGMIWMLKWIKPYIPPTVLQSEWMMAVMIFGYLVYFLAIIIRAVRRTYCFRVYERRGTG